MYFAGLAKSDFDLLFRLYQKHFLTCTYDIYFVNSYKFPPNYFAAPAMTFFKTSNKLA
jgi:hypothetical protein